MKKKIIISVIVIAIFILLVPIPFHLKDGGTVEYKALLYKISKVHELISIEEMEKGKQYNDGIIIEILGFEIYNNTKKLDAYSPTTTIYDKNANIANNTARKKEITEIIENTTIQGIVELNHNGYIYIFNGQHFEEYGFEIQEYSRANIDNKNQECIDYYTSKKYDTSYIQEGDIIICTGDLKKYSIGDSDLDTKDNPIIVLKSEDYNQIKNETINNIRKGVITVGEYYDTTGEIYVKYDISDKEYNLPFVLKFKITKDTKVIGNLEKGKELKIQYKDLKAPVHELELKTIEVIENIDK